MELRYELFGRGWARVSVEIEGRTIELIASYLSDALGDMTAGAIALMHGESEVRFSFQDEPGEYRWIFTSDGEEGLRLTILSFEDCFAPPSDRAGTVILEGSTARWEFASEVAGVLDRIVDSIGVVAYEAEWCGSFPLLDREELKRLLK
jgi:hypothetical protein